MVCGPVVLVVDDDVLLDVVAEMPPIVVDVVVELEVVVSVGPGTGTIVVVVVVVLVVEVVVVDANRPTQNHGTPPKLLQCEFAAVGYQLVAFDVMPSAGGYMARFRAVGARPEPKDIKACRLIS